MKTEWKGKLFVGILGQAPGGWYQFMGRHGIAGN
jgi:hypothetical protein